jgi:hypothetical protein
MGPSALATVPAKIGSHTFAITIELRKFDLDGTFGTLKATATISLNNAATEFTSDEDGYHRAFNPFGVSTGFSGSVRRRARDFARAVSWVALEQHTPLNPGLLEQKPRGDADVASANGYSRGPFHERAVVKGSSTSIALTDLPVTS